MTKIKIFVLAFGLGLGVGCGADAPEEFQFRGDGGFFCCDSTGNCSFTTDGECGEGELLNWCPLTTTNPAGATICKDWG